MASSETRKRIGQHIKALGNPDPCVSARAEGYLIRYYAGRATEELIAACGSDDPIVRLRAAWVLGATREIRGYETILSLCDDPDERVRYDSTIALGMLGDLRAFEPLREMLRREDSAMPAATAISKMGPMAMPLIRELAVDGEEANRVSAVYIASGWLDTSAREECLFVLNAALQDPSEEVRGEARHIMEELRGPSE